MNANFDALARAAAMIVAACACQARRQAGRQTNPWTSRWTTQEAAYLKQAMTSNGPMMTQERAFTSPIWSSPR